MKQVSRKTLLTLPILPNKTPRRPYETVLAWVCRPLSERSVSMVAANKNLLRLARRLAIKDELLAMRLRGRLVAPLVAPSAKKATGTA